MENIGFACCSKESRLATAKGPHLEHNKYVGNASTMMRVLTSTYGDILSHFDENNETLAEINNTSLK